MSSACDDDAIADRATQKRRLRNRATGTFVISNIGAFNLRRSNPSVPRPHSDEERATHDSQGTLPPRAKRNGASRRPKIAKKAGSSASWGERCAEA
jgi:hypothetical protein